jgi:LacI family transcriptional regulator
MSNTRKVVLLIESSRAYGRGLLRGIAKYSRLHGPWMFYRESPFYLKPDSLKKMISNIKKWGATGIIVREQEGLDEILALNLPTIVSPLTERCIPNVPSIYTDCSAIAKLGAEYFLKMGFRHFAFCGYHHKPPFAWSEDRAKVFEEIIAQAGLKTHIYTPSKSQILPSWEKEQLILANWLKTLPKPIAMMTCADDRSQNVIDACRIANIKVPEEIAILGTDNDEIICDLSFPPLSSIILNVEKTGYEAAELLDAGMRGQKIENKLLLVQPLNIVTRQSTEVMAIEDRDIAEAIRYIRKNAKDMIQVNEIAAAIGISRRSLERKFKKTLGCSIYDEIRHIRVEQMARFLVETNYSILRIARTFGLTGVSHIARYFRKEKGISPQAYRKQYSLK